VTGSKNVEGESLNRGPEKRKKKKAGLTIEGDVFYFHLRREGHE